MDMGAQSATELFFRGERLDAEVSAHAARLRCHHRDQCQPLEATLREIAASYGFAQEGSISTRDSSAACTRAETVEALRNRYQVLAGDAQLLKCFYLENICYIDALLGYVLCYVLPGCQQSDDHNSRYARIVLNTCRLVYRRWPGRLDLLSSFMHKTGSLASQKYFPDRALAPGDFYSQTAPSLAYLQELWAKGRYQDIMVHYALYQCSGRLFPSSDYMLRIFTILGLLDRCQSLFRGIYSRLGRQLMTSSLSNMLFTELGMERLDPIFTRSLVEDWRACAALTLLPPHTYSLADGPALSFQSQRITIQEKPVVAVLSADLRNHPVGRFWLPIARRLQRDFRLIHIDFNPSLDDELRSELRASSFEWCSYADQSNHELCRRLIQWQPSVLLDLGGHTADNRPAFLNQRFAPVQATYLGFYGPSYGSECDWWIVDRFIAARTAKSYPGAEPMWELPCPSLCYDPSLHRLPCIDQLRYDHSSSLVIGSFNHTRKLTDQSIARISSILRANPSALFKFRAHSFYDPAVRRFFLQRFVDHGVSPSQLAAIPYAFNPAEAMMDFCRLHLHLDSFPVSGTTTTLDALAMGVPVLTCPNALYAGSISASLLESIGLDSMVCEQASDLPDCANQLFQRYRLPEERRRLATLVRHSALCDSESTPWHFSAALGAMLKSST
jgi:hypothetical protein